MGSIVGIEVPGRDQVKGDWRVAKFQQVSMKKGLEIEERNKFQIGGNGATKEVF